MLASAERQGSSAASWKATPVTPPAVASADGLPSTAMPPLSAVSRPSASLRIVDLPQPEGPIRAVKEPAAQTRETSRSASTLPPRRASKVFETRSSLMPAAPSATFLELRDQRGIEHVAGGLDADEGERLDVGGDALLGHGVNPGGAL